MPTAKAFDSPPSTQPAVRAIAGHYGCFLVDFWQVAAFDDERLWAEDWLHLSPAGHALAAESALDALGVGTDRWRTPRVPAPRAAVGARVGASARWTTRHLAPWALRRLRGESSGNGVEPKHPTWVVRHGA